jgi:hypothetical protein
MDFGRVQHARGIPRERASHNDAMWRARLAEASPGVTCAVETRRPAMIRLLALSLVLALAACVGRPSLDGPSMGGPDIALEEFFDGSVIAHGQFQDRFGEVRRRFVVEVEGTWDGETLTLVEDFAYNDGQTERRVWSLRKTGPDTWAGTAPGVIGEATGTTRGDTFNWTYSIDLPEESGGFRADFDDWMWRLDETRLLNRAYVSRFGVDLGEVIIFFERVD